MKKKLLFPMNIQLFADEEGKGNDLLSYELLKQENEKIKKEFEDYKNEVNKQLEDIKNVIRSGNKVNVQEEQDNGNKKKKDKKELQKELFDDLKNRF